MSMFLEKISLFFRKNRKKIFFYIIFVFIFSLALYDISLAADAAKTTTNTGAGGGDKTDAQKWIDIWNGLVASLATLLGILTYFVTLLLDPKFVSGKMFGIDTKLQELWILISNIVYFVFAFILVWIAFMNIIGKGDKWELKQALPKFIVGVLIVPFSWFFVSLVVSLANILTFAALSLPSDAFKDYDKYLENINIPSKCEINLQQGESKKWIDCSKGEDISLSKITENTTFGLISSYTYGLLKVDKLSTIEGGAIVNGLETVEDLIIYILFSGIFVLAYSILIIALAIVLLVRVIWLWIYMALSPLFGLAYFFGKDSNSEIFKKINITEFIGLAMVPVYVTLALSFGFLFLNITINGLQDSGKKLEVKDKSGIKSSNFTINGSGITIKVNDEDTVQLNVKGGGAFAQMFDSTSKFTGGVFTTQLGVVGGIFLNVFGVVVFWVAIMAALQASSITKDVVAPIKQFSESVGSLVSKAPTYAPIFPGGQSMQSMNKAIASIHGSFETGASNRASKFLENTPFGKNARLQAKLQKIINENNTGMGGPDAIVSRIRETMKLANGDVNKLFTDDIYREALYTSFKRALTDSELKRLGIKKASDIDSLTKLTKVLSAIDKKGNYSNLFVGKDLGEGEIKDVESLVKNLAKGKESSNVSSQTSQSTEQKIKVEYSSQNNEIPIRLNFNGKVIELSNDGKSIKDTSLETFAIGIMNGRTKEEVERLLRDIGLGDNLKIEEIIKAIKSRKGKIEFSKEDKKMKINLKDFGI